MGDGTRPGGEPGGSGGSRGPRHETEFAVAGLLLQLGRVTGALLGLALLTGASALFLLTQTATGRGITASFLEEALEGAVRGEVEVGPITGGNLLTRVRLRRFRISGPDGETFVDLRDVRVSYNPVGFLFGRYHFRRVRTGRMDVRLAQRRDGHWNFDEIFSDDGAATPPATASEGGGSVSEATAAPARGAGGLDPRDAPPPGSATGGSPRGGDGDGTSVIVTDARTEDGRLLVLLPWEGSAGEGEETFWRVRQGEGGGLWQEIAVDSLRGRIPLLRIADPRRPFRIETQALQARARAVTQTLSLRDFTATAEFGDTIMIGVESLATTVSRLSGEGRVRTDGPLRWRFELEGDPLSFQDLRWLPVPVPSVGEGSAGLRLSGGDDLPTTIQVLDGDFRSGPSRLRGSFTLRTTDPVRFDSLDVRAVPMRVELLDALLRRETGVEGTIRGEVTGSGRLDALHVAGDLELRGGLRGGPGTDGAPGEGPAASLRAEGGVDFVEPGAVRDLALEMDSLPPAWTRLVGVETELRGRVSGSLRLNHPHGGPLSFRADLSHRGSGGGVSRVRGDGSVFLNPPADAPIRLQLEADPLALSLLQPYLGRYVGDRRLVGTVRGPLSVSGTPSDLQVDADLATPRGQLTIAGRFDLASEREGYDARVTARGLELRQWVEDAPRTRIAVRGRVEGEGLDPANLRAAFDLTVLPSRVAGARVDTSMLRFAVEEGAARIDTFAVRTDVGRVRGRGTFGLTPERSGSLVLTLEADDLSRWNRWIVPGRRVSAGDAGARDLFQSFPEARKERETLEELAEVGADTLAGQVIVQGVAYGNVQRFGFEGEARARDARYGATSADSLLARLEVADVRSADSLLVEGTAWEFRRSGLAVESLRLRLERGGESLTEVETTVMWDSTHGAMAAGTLDWRPERKVTQVRSLGLILGPERLELQEPTRVTYGTDGLRVGELVMAGDDGRSVTVDGRVRREGPAEFDITVEGLSLVHLRHFVSVQENVSGRLSGTLRVRGTAQQPRMEGRISVEEPGFESVSYSGLDVSFRYEDRRLEGRGRLGAGGRELLRMRGRIRADLSLREGSPRLLEDPFDLRFEADRFPARLLEIPVEDFRKVRGHVDGDVRITGGPGRLRFDGGLNLSEGRADIPALGVRLERVRARVRFDGSRARVDSFRVTSSAGGRAGAAGTVDLRQLSNPEFDLQLRAHGFRGMERRKARVAVDGQGELGGTYQRPVLTGSFRLSDGTIRTQEFLRAREVVDLSDPLIYGLVDTAGLAERRILARSRNPFLQNLRADVRLRIGPDLWLRSPNLEVEMSGELDLRMDQAEGDVRLFGTLQMVRGSYRYTKFAYSRQLRISEGTIEFVGTPGMNPNLDITAVHRTRTKQGPLVVRAQITGTMLSPAVALSSEPPLSESDQLCVLLFNAPCVPAGRAPGQLAAEQLLGTVGSQLSTVFAGEALDYVEVRSGRPGGLDDTEQSDEGVQSLFRTTEVEVGKYLTPELFLTVTQPLGNRLPAVSLDWRFATRWSLELRSEHRFSQVLGTASTSNLERRRLWGIFLFRDWSF